MDFGANAGFFRADFLKKLLVLFLFIGCSENNTASIDSDWEVLFSQTDVIIDTVGARNLSKFDSSSSHEGLVIIDRQYTFPTSSDGGEVIAWEFYAESKAPVKLILVKFNDSKEMFEIIGESETLVPKNIGINRHILKEPIPIFMGCMMGLVQTKGGTIPFRKIRGYRTFIADRELERPFMRRDVFAVYGWRYNMRVFWRSTNL